MLATSTYRENRARMPVEELQRWEGQWVAFVADGSRIVGGAADLRQLVEALRETGMKTTECVFERIEFDGREEFVGGAEGP